MRLICNNQHVALTYKLSSMQCAAVKIQRLLSTKPPHWKRPLSLSRICHGQAPRAAHWPLIMYGPTFVMFCERRPHASTQHQLIHTCMHHVYSFNTGHTLLFRACKDSLDSFDWYYLGLTQLRTGVVFFYGAYFCSLPYSRWASLRRVLLFHLLCHTTCKVVKHFKKE